MVSVGITPDMQDDADHSFLIITSLLIGTQNYNVSTCWSCMHAHAILK